MKALNLSLKPRFTRGALLTLVAFGLSAAAADAAQVVTIPLEHKEFGHGIPVHAESTGSLNPATVYFYKVLGTCRGTGMLEDKVKPNTSLADLLNRFSAGAASKLVGTKQNPGGKLDFSLLNYPVTGEVDGISVSMTFSLFIDAAGKVAFDIQNVSVTHPLFGPVPGTILLEDGAKVVAGIPVIKVASPTKTVSEDAGKVVVEVKRTGNLNVTARFDYETFAGTATDAHFEQTAGTLTFKTGQKSKKIAVLIKDNNLKDGARTFSVKLSNPVNAVLGSAKTVVTITSDE